MDRIQIGFTGDFCPRLRVEKLLRSDGLEEAFASVLPFFRENDLNIIDLECPLTAGGNAIVKTGPHLRAHPDAVRLLKLLNCQLVATANNHFLDYGRDGMRDTYRALEEEGIEWVGSGLTTDEIRNVNFQEIGNLRFAFINATENEWSTLHSGGSGCNSLDPVTLFQDIRRVRDKTDYIVVIVHGGHEHYNLPSPRTKRWYRFLVDAGADAVIGHHTHTISGYEVYNGAPIFYSLGNFCIDSESYRDHPWNRGMLVRLIADEQQSLSFEVKFVTQNNHEPGVCLLSGPEEEIMHQKIVELNEIIADDVQLDKSFDAFVRSQEKITNARIQPYTGTLLVSLHTRGLLPTLFGKRKKILLTNLLRCESHRELLIDTLKHSIG